MLHLEKNINSDTKKILLVDEDNEFCRSFEKNGAKHGLVTNSCPSASSILNSRETDKVSAVLLDSELDRKKNYGISKSLIQKNPSTRIYSLIHDKGLDNVSDALDHGASNVFALSIGPAEIAKRVAKDINNDAPKLRNENCVEYPKLIGKSKKHIEILEKISQIKNVDTTVLITGESGTGKEMVAKALHEASERSNAKFEAINCGAIPENLLESELFGHKRGAFTDAKMEKKGLFEICSKGTLLLDEIGEMPLALQVKLLRVLQEREIRQVGATHTTKVGTRVLAATNRNLWEEVEAGRFREDLFYRLSILRIHIPPLRKRRKDIPVLASKFLQDLSQRHGKSLAQFSTGQLERLSLHSWHGNVRELQNSIERAVILARNNKIHFDDLFDSQDFHSKTKAESQSSLMLNQSIPDNYLEAKEYFERHYLKNLLEKSNGNVSEAARLAGKSRVEIYRFLTRNQIRPVEFRK